MEDWENVSDEVVEEVWNMQRFEGEQDEEQLQGDDFLLASV